MREFCVIKLHSLTPIHIGTGRDSYDTSSNTIHSDMLMGALASLWVQSNGANGIKGFLESFQVSSCFPFFEDKYFLPKPMGRINLNYSNLDPIQQYELNKSIKKVRYITLHLWEKLINGESLEVQENHIKGIFLSDDKLDNGNVTKSEVEQRVSVPVIYTKDPVPFYFERTFFHDNAGLYCFLETSDNTRKNEVISLFRLLGENGIGTDKNVGNGLFKVAESTIRVHVPASEKSILLSLYIPNEEEMDNLMLKPSKYELVLRGGYMAGSEKEEFRHLKKKSIYAFKEGSWFHSSSPKGKIVNLKPEWNDNEMHDVWRDGRAFYIPVKL